jgi:hypothetical protein
LNRTFRILQFQIYRRVIEKRSYADGISVEGRISFSRSESQDGGGNFSQRAFEDALNSGAFRGNLTSSDGNKIRGIAGESIVIDHLRKNDTIVFLVQRVVAVTLSQPLGTAGRGVGMTPDILNVHLPTNAEGAPVVPRLARVASGAGGSTRSVELSVNVVSVYFEVKSGFSPANIPKGADQVANLATALKATGGTGVAVLAIDKQAWMKLSPERRQEIYNKVTAAGGYIQLWSGLAVQAAQRARTVINRASARRQEPN